MQSLRFSHVSYLSILLFVDKLHVDLSADGQTVAETSLSSVQDRGSLVAICVQGILFITMCCYTLDTGKISGK